MTAATLTIAGRKFRVVPEKDFQAMQAALRQQERQAAEDRSDVLLSQKRLRDPREKAHPLDGREKACRDRMTYRVEFTS